MAGLMLAVTGATVVLAVVADRLAVRMEQAALVTLRLHPHRKAAMAVLVVALPAFAQLLAVVAALLLLGVLGQLLQGMEAMEPRPVFLGHL